MVTATPPARVSCPHFTYTLPSVWVRPLTAVVRREIAGNSPAGGNPRDSIAVELPVTALPSVDPLREGIEPLR